MVCACCFACIYLFLKLCCDSGQCCLRWWDVFWLWSDKCSRNTRWMWSCVWGAYVNRTFSIIRWDEWSTDETEEVEQEAVAGWAAPQRSGLYAQLPLCEESTLTCCLRKICRLWHAVACRCGDLGTSWPVMDYPHSVWEISGMGTTVWRRQWTILSEWVTSWIFHLTRHSLEAAILTANCLAGRLLRKLMVIVITR